MTGVATPPAPAPATGRACPRCGAGLAPDQEWCLNCGTAVSTRIAPTPRWRVPVVLVGVLLALLVAALVLALVELSGDPQPVAKGPGATPTPAAAPADDGGGSTAPVAGATPTPAATPGAGATPSATPSAGATPAPGATPATGTSTTWPTGRSAWTVVLASTPSRSEAEAKAAAKPGAGVLHSNNFTSLRKGYWVVFSGQYDTRKAAESAATSDGGDAYARRVVPR